MPAKKPAKRPSSLDVVVGRNVRIWRLAKGLSQSQLASRLGVTFQQIQKYEVGSNRIGTGRLVKIAGTLGVPISMLFEGADGAGQTSALLSLVADSRSFRLAHAFAAIDNSSLRLSLVNLVEQVAAAVPQAQPRRKATRAQG
jgi:transcriptional regulator with XRE-family HTH domain